jgi:hypothetical protein
MSTFTLQENEGAHTKTNDASKIEASFVTFPRNFHPGLFTSASVAES